jgi:hypothetical protein
MGSSRGSRSRCGPAPWPRRQPCSRPPPAGALSARAATQVITPWDVTGGADGKVDYNKLVAQVRAITRSPARPRAAAAWPSAAMAAVAAAAPDARPPAIRAVRLLHAQRGPCGTVSARRAWGPGAGAAPAAATAGRPARTVQHPRQRSAAPDTIQPDPPPLRSAARPQRGAAHRPAGAPVPQARHLLCAPRPDRDPGLLRARAALLPVHRQGAPPPAAAWLAVWMGGLGGMGGSDGRMGVSALLAASWIGRLAGWLGLPGPWP